MQACWFRVKIKKLLSYFQFSYLYFAENKNICSRNISLILLSLTFIPVFINLRLKIDKDEQNDYCRGRSVTPDRI